MKQIQTIKLKYYNDSLNNDILDDIKKKIDINIDSNFLYNLIVDNNYHIIFIDEYKKLSSEIIIYLI